MTNTTTEAGKERRAKTVKINYLLRAHAVQQDFQAETREGVPDSFVWRKHIYPRHFISMATFYRYLSVNVRKELRNIGVEPETVLD